MVPSPGHRFVVADWRHSQLRIAAGLSRDQALLAALQPGQDTYQRTGQAIGLAGETGRAVGKALSVALLLRAGPGGIRQALELAGVEPNALDPATVLETWRTSFPDLYAWQQTALGLEELTLPLGRVVQVPTNRRYLQAVLAGILQGAEADALRIVLAGTSEEMADLEAQVVLAIHDEVLWEVPVGRAEEAARRATALMEQALGAVCAPCPAEVSVEIRGSWAKKGK
jgi:DNA polymerase-1